MSSKLTLLEFLVARHMRLSSSMCSVNFEMTILKLVEWDSACRSEGTWCCTWQLVVAKAVGEYDGVMWIP